MTNPVGTRRDASLPGLLITGLAMGFISGLTGFGGGIVLVPALIFIFGLRQHAAQGTALWVIIPTAFMGASKYFLSGNMDISYALWIAAGSMSGVLLGSTLAHKTPAPWLRKIFGIIALVIAIKTIFF